VLLLAPCLVIIIIIIIIISQGVTEVIGKSDTRVSSQQLAAANDVHDDEDTKCGQSLYAIKVLRSHGMCVDALKDIYRAVVLAKLLYASPAWWGFATTADKQRIESFVRRGVRLGLYGDGDPTASLLHNSLKTPTKACSTESSTINIMSCNSSFLSSTVTTTVSDPDVTTLSWLQKLTLVTSLQEKCSLTFINSC